MTICGDEVLTPLRKTPLGARRPLTETSEDGVWEYEFSYAGLYRAAGRQCLIRHVPTGVIADRVRSLTVALRFTANGSAMNSLRAMAQSQADGRYGPGPVARARVVLQILDGTVLAPGAEESRCACGGYLARQAGKLLHVDTCEEEIHVTGPCPDERVRHRFCQRPEAVQCEHNQCHRANDINAHCQTGHDNCCGECCS